MIFAIIKHGKLMCAGGHSILGKGRREFAIDPSGNFLLVVKQEGKDHGIQTGLEIRAAYCHSRKGSDRQTGMPVIC